MDRLIGGHQKTEEEMDIKDVKPDSLHYSDLDQGGQSRNIHQFSNVATDCLSGTVLLQKSCNLDINPVSIVNGIVVMYPSDHGELDNSIHRSAYTSEILSKKNTTAHLEKDKVCESVERNTDGSNFLEELSGSLTREFKAFSIFVQENFKTKTETVQNDSKEVQRDKLLQYTEKMITNFWDEASECFIHPTIIKPLTLQETIDCGFLWPDIVQVQQVDGSTQDLHEAILTGQVNISTGHTLDLSSGKMVPFHEAVKSGLISVPEKNQKDKEKPSPFGIGRAHLDLIIDGKISPNTRILDKKSNRLLTVQESIECNIFSSEHGYVKDTLSGIWLPWDEAERMGLIVDENFQLNSTPKKSKKGKSVTWNLNEDRYEFSDYIMSESESEVTDDYIDDVNVADTSKDGVDNQHSWMRKVAEGKTFSGLMLDEAIRQNLYDPVMNQIYSEEELRSIPFEEAVKEGLINKSSLVRDPVSSDILTLEDALEKRLIDPESGKMLDSTGQPIALNFAFKIGLIMKSRSPLKLSLSEVLEEGLYDITTGKFLDPETNEEMELSRALNVGLLDPNLIRVRDMISGHMLTFEEACSRRLFQVESATCQDTLGNEKLSIEEGLERGILVDITSQPNLTLQYLIDEGIFDPSSGTFQDPLGNSNLTVKDAVESKLLDPDSVSIRDPRSLTILSINGAISENIVDPVTGHYDNQGISHTFFEAIEKGLIFTHRQQERPFTIDEAIRLNIFDAESRSFIDPKSGTVLTLKGAIDNNLINPKKTMVKDTQTNKFLSLENAAYLGVVNLDACEITDLKNGDVMDLKMAVERGMIRRSSSDECISLLSALSSERIDVNGRVLDVLSKRRLTLSDAIVARIIDPRPTVVKDFKADKFMPLVTAIASGIIDETDGSYNDNLNNIHRTLAEAAECGYILDVPFHGLTLAEFVRQGLYDFDTGLFLDVRNAQYVPLSEGIRRGIIDESPPQVVIPQYGLLTLRDAMREGYIDHDTGAYVPLGIKYSLKEAVEKNLIITVGKRKHKKSSSDSGCEDLPLAKSWNDCLVRDSVSKSFIPFAEAVEAGIVDTVTETICDMRKKEITSLAEAHDKGQIVNAKHPKFGLVCALDQGLFDNRSNSFHDPRNDTHVSLEEGLLSGLIDGAKTRIFSVHTGLFGSLQDALSSGTISGKTASLLDKEGKRTIPIELAIKMKYIVDFKKVPYTLDEGIKFGFINTSTLQAEDPETGRKISLQDLFHCGIIDWTNSFVKFGVNEGKICIREAIERKLFDLKTGIFKAPGGDLTLGEAYAGGMLESRLFQGGHGESEGDTVVSICPVERSATRSSELLAKNEEAEHFVLSQKNVESSLPTPLGQHSHITHWISAVSKGSDQGAERFEDALEQGKINVDSCFFIDEQMNKSMTLLQSVESGKLNLTGVVYHDRNTSVDVTLEQALRDSLITENSDQTDGQNSSGISLRQALDEGLIVVRTHPNISQNDDVFTNISETCSNHSQPLPQNQPIDWLQSSKSLSSSLDSLLQKFKQEPTSFKIGTLFDALQKSLIDEVDGTLEEPFSMRKLTISEAMKCGLINPNVKEIIDPRTQECLSLAEAVDRKLIDPLTGKYINPASSEKISLATARDCKFIIASKDSYESKSPVEIYVEEILSNDQARGKNKLQEAFASGVLHRSNSQVIDPDTVQPITLRRAASLGMIDVKTGEFKNPQTGECMPLSQAVEKGFILSPKGLSLYSAVNQGLYSGKTEKFVEQTTNKEYSLKEMIDMEIITPDCLEVRDLTQGGEIVKLKEAIEIGLIDAEAGNYVNLVDGKRYNFNDAIAAGLILSNSPREGLRESSNSITSVVGFHKQHCWTSFVKDEAACPEGPSLHFRPDHQVQSRNMLEPNWRPTASLSSMETETSSGYETNISQTPQLIEDIKNPVIDFNKYILKKPFEEEIASNQQSSAADKKNTSVHVHMGELPSEIKKISNWLEKATLKVNDTVCPDFLPVNEATNLKPGLSKISVELASSLPPLLTPDRAKDFPLRTVSSASLSEEIKVGLSASNAWFSLLTISWMECSFHRQSPASAETSMDFHYCFLGNLHALDVYA